MHLEFKSLAQSVEIIQLKKNSNVNLHHFITFHQGQLHVQLKPTCKDKKKKITI